MTTDEARRPLPFLLLSASLALGFVGTRSYAPTLGAPVGHEPTRQPPTWVVVAPAPGPDGVDGPRPKPPSGAIKALQHWGAQRAYPNPTLPDAAFGSALTRVRELRARTGGVEALAPPWQSLGPTNIGGRTLSLALHPADPDVIFAGSASGGLWKSTTGGVGADAWDPVDTGYPILGVSTIAIDPSDPDVMYIGTGEAYSYADSIGGDAVRLTRGSYGVGILKSTDGGSTWSASLDWTYQQSRAVWMIQIHPTDQDIVYAATTEGVYKSIDAGGSWSLVHGVVMAMDVRIHPSAPDTVFASHGNFDSAGRGIYRSLDAGQNWTRLSTGLPATWAGKAQLAIAPTSPDTIFASIGDVTFGYGLYRSTNAGNSWTRVNNTDYQSYQGWFAHYVVVSPFDAQTLFASGVEIWRSTNGGAALSERSRWQSVFMGTSPPQGPIGGPDYAHADHHFAVWHPTDPNTVFFASDGGVFKTTDLGTSFESLIGGYQTTQFYNGFSQSTTSANFAIGGLQDNFTAIYEGDGAWRRAIGGDGSWTAVNPSSPTTVYGSAQYLLMFRSRNSGNNWTDIEPPQLAGDATAFIAPFVLCPDVPSVLYAARSRVYRSNDEGDNWTATNGGAQLDPGNPVISLAVAESSPTTAYAGTAPVVGRARVFTTRDGGTNWLDVTGPLPDRYPSDITVDPNDATTVYVTFMGFGTSHLFRSTDGGDTWQDIGNGLPDIPASAVVVDPDHGDVIYVGTDLGVFVSVDSGGSWQPFTDGMPLAMVNDLKVFRAGRKLRAATHGNGAYERDLLELPDIGVTLCSLDAAMCVGSVPHPAPPHPGETVQVTLRFDNTNGTAVAADLVGSVVASNAVVTVPAGGDLSLLSPLSIPAGGFTDVSLELIVDEGVTCPATIDLFVQGLSSDGGQFAYPDQTCTSPFAVIDCSTTCPRCGDGVLDPGESCDDGDIIACDGCSPSCQLECGNGVVECAEDCDDGAIDTTSCDADCSAVVCGDGHLNVAAGEECDDGNTQEGDGCTAACLNDCASLLPRVDLLWAVRGPAEDAELSWSAVSSPDVHINYVITKAELLDPRVSGNGTTDCVSSSASCWTSPYATVGVRFYQALAACGPSDEGPF